MFKPELRHTSNETPVTDFNLAMTESWRSKANGELRQETTWVKVVCWGRLAESIVPIIEKGDLVLVEGKITVRDRKHDDGSIEKVTEIEASNVLKTNESRRNSNNEDTSSVEDCVEENLGNE